MPVRINVSVPPTMHLSSVLVASSPSTRSVGTSIGPLGFVSVSDATWVEHQAQQKKGLPDQPAVGQSSCLHEYWIYRNNQQKRKGSIRTNNLRKRMNTLQKSSRRNLLQNKTYQNTRALVGKNAGSKAQRSTATSALDARGPCTQCAGTSTTRNR